MEDKMVNDGLLRPDMLSSKIMIDVKELKTGESLGSYASAEYMKFLKG